MLTDKTYHLETFGCQMNVLDSQLLEGQFQQRGMRQADSVETADVILFNTCSVRQHAEDKVLSRLGNLRKLKQSRPNVIIGVIGCMAQRLKDELFVEVPFLDIVCGPGELPKLPNMLEKASQSPTPIVAITSKYVRNKSVLERSMDDDPLEPLDQSRKATEESSILQSYVRVQRGCDNFCTYCIVPFTRGPERSRRPMNIVDEVRDLAAKGCREVTLLGQTVNSYVYADNGSPVTFAKLLERVHEVEGIDRIRFVTSYPADWDEDIFRVMRDLPRLCPYLHIPAQSGSDRILKAMNRNYTADSYRKLMETARKYVPDIALAGDFIVGFGGETEEDFQKTVQLVKDIEYKQIFVFKYSPRPGTAADRKQIDDIPEDVKAERNRALLAVQMEIMEKKKQENVGRVVEVLVEGYSKWALQAQAAERREEESQLSEQDRTSEASRKRTDQLIGRTPHDIITVFPGDPSHIGSLVKVRVNEASALTLFGEIEDVVSPTKLER